MKHRSRSTVLRIRDALVAFLFLLGAPLSGYFLGRIFLEAKSSAAWPSVVGTITKAQVGETNVGRFFADVAYSYRVADRNLEGSRIRASHGEYDLRDGAVQALSGLSEGKQVRVFYDPNNPRRALLQVGAGFQEHALLLVPIAMFLIGVWAFRRAI